jgi:hypothetical protein
LEQLSALRTDHLHLSIDLVTECKASESAHYHGNRILHRLSTKERGAESKSNLAADLLTNGELSKALRTLHDLRFHTSSSFQQEILCAPFLGQRKSKNTCLHLCVEIRFAAHQGGNPSF